MPVSSADFDLDLALRDCGRTLRRRPSQSIRVQPAAPARSLFQCRAHPPSSWGLIEHGIETTTVLYSGDGTPMILAGILRDARDKLGDRADISEIFAGAYNFESDGKLIFYVSVETHHTQLLLDAAVRDAAMRRYSMHSQVSRVIDNFTALVNTNGILVPLLREFPVTSCP